MISTTTLRGRLVALGSAILAAGTLLSTPAFAGGNPHNGGGGTCTTNIPVVDTYNGRATDISVYAGLLQVIGAPVKVGNSVNDPFRISDTGELGPTSVENTKESHLVSVDLPLPDATAPLVRVQAGILDAVTTGMGNTTTSWANIVGLNLNVNNQLTVSAGLIQATAKATQNQPASCSAGSPTGQPVGSTVYEGSSQLVDLQISLAGTPINIPANAPPNTEIEIPGVLLIVLNEQRVENGRQIVNAVHITLGDPSSPLSLLATADIIIAHADAGISGNCGVPTTTCPPGCTPKDFMTGGGWITLTGGAKGTFGFNGGYKPNGLRGHLTYIDHGTGLKIKGTDVVQGGYVTTGPTSRDITYVCNDGLCKLSVGDFGEPGGGVDKFALQGDTYTAEGPYITRGNIQIHKSSCPATSGGKPGKGK